MYFVLVTLCTCFNMFLGLLSLYLALCGQPFWAAWALLASVCFDACDGYLARKWGVASEFGAQLDSLADFASFCLAGGVLAYAWAAAQGAGDFSLAQASDYQSGLWGVGQALVQGGDWVGYSFPPLKGEIHYLFLGAIFLYTCLGGMRLARYNAQTDSLCPPSFFDGLPTTGAAALIAIFCLADFMAPPSWWEWSPGGVLLLTVILGLLMFSHCPYPKVTKIDWLPRWAWFTPLAAAFLTLPGSAYLFAGLYLVSGPLYSWYQSQWRKDSPEAGK